MELYHTFPSHISRRLSCGNFNMSPVTLAYEHLPFGVITNDSCIYETAEVELFGSKLRHYICKNV